MSLQVDHARYLSILSLMALFWVHLGVRGQLVAFGSVQAEPRPRSPAPSAGRQAAAAGRPPVGGAPTRPGARRAPGTGM